MIGLIGFGRFGRLAARCLAHESAVAVYRRPGDPVAAIEALGACPADLAQVCANRYVILCVPISTLPELLRQIAPLIKPGTLVADVCAVKSYPARWMIEQLPAETEILATHPLFGPDSAADTPAGGKIVLCPVRIRAGRYRRIRRFLSGIGLTLIETTPDEHDRQAAFSLGLTHFIGRALAQTAAADLAVDTPSYRRLRAVQQMALNDTRQLFEELHRFNPYAAAVRRDLLNALTQLDATLQPPAEPTC